MPESGIGESAVELRPLARADVAEAARVLARAFREDPVSGWVLPDPGSRERRLRRYFLTLMRHQMLGLDGAQTALVDGSIAGVALWLPPGHLMATAREKFAALPGFALAYGRRLGAASELVQSMYKVHPKEPHWYLDMIGTDPDRRGLGVGAALLRSRLRTCDEQRMPAYLESSNPGNVPLYEHFGFEVRDGLRLPEGVPEVTPMWRPPAA